MTVEIFKIEKRKGEKRDIFPSNKLIAIPMQLHIDFFRYNLKLYLSAFIPGYRYQLAIMASFNMLR